MVKESSAYDYSLYRLRLLMSCSSWSVQVKSGTSCSTSSPCPSMNRSQSEGDSGIDWNVSWVTSYQTVSVLTWHQHHWFDSPPSVCTLLATTTSWRFASPAHAVQEWTSAPWAIGSVDHSYQGTRLSARWEAAALSWKTVTRWMRHWMCWVGHGQPWPLPSGRSPRVLPGPSFPSASSDVTLVYYRGSGR